MDRRNFVRGGVAAGLSGAAGLAGLLGAPGRARGLDRAEAGWAPRGKTFPDGTLRLNSNENPLGLSPAAREAVMAAIPDANRYPFSFSPPLYTALAAHLGVAEENLTLGAGSTEILQMAVHAYQGPNTPLILAEPTFEDVTDYQRPLPYDMVKVPLRQDLAHDVERMRDLSRRRGRPCVVYLCNPNNPTGTVTPSAELDAWIEEAPETTVFLVDEAYFEYAASPAYHSAIHWIDRKPNVIVARTFSKLYGMAGLRLGYAVAHPSTIRRLDEFVCQNNPNVLANAAALASLADEALVDRSLAVNREARAIAQSTLDDLGLESLPTETNFLMHRIRGDLERYIERMRERGIHVGRPFPPMLQWNRLSFGLPDEMDRWAEALKDLRRKDLI